MGNRNGPVENYCMQCNWLIRLARAGGPLGLFAPSVDALSVIDDFYISYT